MKCAAPLLNAPQYDFPNLRDKLRSSLREFNLASCRKRIARELGEGNIGLFNGLLVKYREKS